MHEQAEIHFIWQIQYCIGSQNSIETLHKNYHLMLTKMVFWLRQRNSIDSLLPPPNPLPPLILLHFPLNIVMCFFYIILNFKHIFLTP